jgi:hypothetical protein
MPSAELSRRVEKVVGTFVPRGSFSLQTGGFDENQLF